MVFQIIHPVEPANRVKEYYSIIHNAIGGCIDDSHLWLVKREGWTVAIAHIEPI